eukprot:4976978-Prymnesium_polylepis.1
MRHASTYAVSHLPVPQHTRPRHIVLSKEPVASARGGGVQQAILRVLVVSKVEHPVPCGALDVPNVVAVPLRTALKERALTQAFAARSTHLPAAGLLVLGDVDAAVVDGPALLRECVAARVD